MNLNQSLIFSYLEEDNIQRAYFRVRPLLTCEGDIRQDALKLWPNEGGLRIVPDRNEQHTFKTRMRTLGAYCVVDLRDQPPEAGKIRTNKNFRPDRGELNQYILYSDTVHELPENTFYHLIAGQAADYSSLADTAITPRFYIREDDTIYGPVEKRNPTQPTPAEEAAGILFEIPCPDGVSRMILCMNDASAKTSISTASIDQPVHDTPIADADSKSTANPEKSESGETHPALETPSEERPDELPIGESLQIIDQGQKHEETIKKLDQPVSTGANLLHDQSNSTFDLPVAIKTESLGGTPLVHTPLHVSIQQTKNKTQEVINNQWSIGKYEPPAQNLPVGTAMRTVENPVETACIQLRSAWNVTSAHDQITNCILSLEGIIPILEEKLCNGNTGTILQHILHRRLQDLEAERLTALCELDRAQRDIDSYKQELISSLAKKINKETGAISARKSELESQLVTLKKELNALTYQRDALLARVHELQNATLPETVSKLLAEVQMTIPATASVLRMSPVSGIQVELEVLIDKIMKTCDHARMSIDRNTAIALIVLLAICPRIGFSTPTPAPAATLARNLATAMGWNQSYAHQYSQEQQPLIGVRPVDATPAVLMSSLPNYSPLMGGTKLILNRNTLGLIRNAAYDISQWPIWTLPALPFVEEFSTADVMPISASSLTKVTEKLYATEEELNLILNPILKFAVPLSGSALKEMYRFASICAGIMDGGLPAAVDWAILLWIIPALERGSKAHSSIKSLLNEYPLSYSKL